MAEHIGQKVFTLRMRQGLTQAQLAKGICDRSHISMIEAGRCTPSISLLEKIAGRLKLALPDLLDEVTPPSRETSYSFDLLIDHLKELMDEGQYYDGSVLIRKYLRHPDMVDSPDKMAILHRYAGILDAMKKQYDRAEANLLKAREYAEKSRDQQILVEVNLSVGALQNFMANYRESESTYNKILSRAPKEMPLVLQIKLHYGLGLALQGQGKLHQAVHLLKSRLELLIKNNSTYLYGEISALIAACYEKMNTFKEAIPYYQKVAAYYTFTGNAEQAAYIQERIDACYAAINCEENSECSVKSKEESAFKQDMLFTAFAF